MIRVAGCEVDEVLYEGSRSRVFRGTGPDGGRVVVKLPAAAYPSRDELRRCRVEFEVGSALTGEHRVEYLQLARHEESLALIMRDGGGTSLNHRIGERGLPLDRALIIAIGLAARIGELHDAGWVHRDVKPANVLVTESDVRLIDFNLSAPMGRRASSEPLRRLEGTLHYLSPEQTGRTDRPVDHRTDLYSFGVVLFELVSGRPPFQGDDPIKLLHAHLALSAPRLDEVVDHCPPRLAALVARLLSKNPDDRYRSAWGVHADLVAIADGFDPELGAHDLPLHLLIPDRLIGRENEQRALLDSFHAMLAGASQLVMVSGYSGVGKSALVQSVRQPILEADGVFARGKFDQLLRGVPYSAFADALGSAVRQTLAGMPARQAWAIQRIRDAVGVSGRVLTDVIPELELLIGPQPDVLALGPVETEARFLHVATGFIGALGSREYPLVLFVDDLQWADPASLALLRVIADDPSVRHVLVLGAFRDNEVDSAHPLSRLLDDLRSRRPVPELKLGPLDQAQVARLIGDALKLSPAKVAPLADLVFRKTGGNPFFLRSFLDALDEDGLLTLDRAAGRWVWDLDAAEREGMTDNVVELMASGIRRFPEATQQVLKLAASIGNRFELSDLAAVGAMSEDSALEALTEALSRGFVLPEQQIAALGPGEEPTRLLRYRFQHDRVQQAARGLVSDAQRVPLHRLIGDRLLARWTAEGGRDDQLPGIVSHLNSAMASLETPEERHALALLNRRAAGAARQAAAHATTVRLLGAAWALLGDAAWESDYELALATRQEEAEAAWQSGDRDLLARIYADVVQHARRLEDRATVEQTRLYAAYAANDVNGAIAVSRAFVSQLGVRIPAKANPLLIARGLIASKIRMRGRTREDLLGLPLMEDSRTLAAMEVLASTLTPTWQAEPELFLLVSMEMLRLTLKYGLHRHSTRAFAAYAIILSGALGDSRAANEMNSVAAALTERLNVRQYNSTVLLVQGVFIDPFLHPPAVSLRTLEEGFAAGLYAGDHDSAGSCGVSFLYYGLYAGMPIPELSRQIQSMGAGIERTGVTVTIKNVFRVEALVEALQGRSTLPGRLVTAKYDGDAQLALERAHNAQNSIAHMLIFEGFAAVFLGNWERAAQVLCEAEVPMKSLPSTAVLAAWYLFRAVAVCRVAARGTRPKEARQGLAKCRAWAEIQPVTYAHRAALIEAELARLAGDSATAFAKYEMAIEGASAGGFVHEQGLASELAAHLHVELGTTRAGRAYAQDAMAAYRRWGASAVQSRLAGEYAAWLAKGTTSMETISGTGGTLAASVAGTDMGEAVDFSAVLKAALAISREIQLDRLKRELVTIAIQSAGAERGVLILLDGGQARIETGAGGATVKTAPLDGTGLVPEGLVRYVLKSGRPVVLRDAARDPDFASDPYVARTQPRSVLCAPISSGGEQRGAIYLENNLAPGAFTPGRLEIVGLLAAQAAISIENARLVDNLELKVQQRTSELEQARERSDDLLRNILPDTIAEELMARGSAEPVHYESASVLFTDFRGFTGIAESLTPKKLVDELDRCFSAFDEIVSRHGLEKLKTIGDSYMCAGGVPEPNYTHAVDCVMAGLQLQRWADRLAQERGAQGRTAWSLRLGVNSGPLVAGVIGRRKFAYDVWGDTVNTASRMESSGVVGKVNISAATRELVGDLFVCEARGEVSAKNKGSIAMHFVHRLRPEFSADDDGFEPNDAFRARRDVMTSTGSHAAT